MQPLILIAIVVAAAFALSFGYLGNEVDITMTQQFGVAEKTFQSPVNSVFIEAQIAETGELPDGFKDIYVACLFSSNETIFSGSTLICKLLDEREEAITIANVVAEGTKIVNIDIDPNTTITVSIDFLKFLGADSVGVIHDMIFVILGP